MKEIVKNIRLIYLNLVIVSTVIICFEIISTRISSVIFVNNYAFIILSLAILGLGCGGIFTYLKYKSQNQDEHIKLIPIVILLLGFSLLLFTLSVTNLGIAKEPYFYFLLLFIPFFIAGIFYSLVFKTFASSSFSIYAADLTGAALGSIGSILAINLLGGINSILLLSIIIFLSALTFQIKKQNKYLILFFYIFLFVSMFTILIQGSRSLLGKIPIGNYPEKDFHHTYQNPDITSQIVDSRWSIHGRSDLVEYSHQDLIKSIFIDGAAGSPMYKFSADRNRLNQMIYNILIRFSTSIPFLWLENYEKNNMLVLGPGGGREVLIGLLVGIEEITGVEVNPDFVDIVKDYSFFNGGIYTDFPNVSIEIQEGRHYIKRTENNYDLIVMALPSTEQLQNIDNFAASENFLITVEAIKDYLDILTYEGQLIFTLHNNWELMRLLVSVFYAFEDLGINRTQALNHFIIIEDEGIPTIVIKKQPYSKTEVSVIKKKISDFPEGLPEISFLPYQKNNYKNSNINKFLLQFKSPNFNLENLIASYKYDISPSFDDSPYFYKIRRGIPQYLIRLFIGVLVFVIILVLWPYYHVSKKIKINDLRTIQLSLMIFSAIGAGFMIIEIALFQKFILYLGSPTVSLAILLCSLLTGMGLGSYFGKSILQNNILKKIQTACLLIILLGILFYTFIPALFDMLLAYHLIYRVVISILVLIPLGFFLGIPFPTAIQLLDKNNLKKYIPWMYGINGVMTVLGSVLAAIISMVSGFTTGFFVGLGFYLFILVFLHLKRKYVSI
ncbi:MAG: hypothetical protein JXR46_07995 [Calditrichaceae bacterium]|nr:hypothetical protein [Calditrichaceae bacterium]MBN2708970.1 hypothetical protein [Calditrichaceae bacterium]RQV97508.1 MAG: hypothetical protein EH224_00365 [Calditrichota bacterium]